MKVAIMGAAGRMGRVLIEAVEAAEGLTLGAAILPWGILFALALAFWRSRFMTAVRQQMRANAKRSESSVPPSG